jgi:hypothetical protein
MRHWIMFGGTALCAVALSIAALGFDPPQSSPQQPPGISNPSGEPTPTTEKSTTGPSKSTIEIKPTSPAPRPLVAFTLQPQRVSANWMDRLYFDPLTLIIAAEKGTPECADAMAAASELAGDYIGRVTVLVECYDSSSPSLFAEIAAKGKPASKNWFVILHQHDMTTHIKEIVKPTGVWGDQAFLNRIAKSDGQRLLELDHLSITQVRTLSKPSQTRWLNGSIDAESLRLWLEVRTERDMGVAIKKGPARLRELKEEYWRSLYATRLAQPVIFVPKKMLEAGNWNEDEVARTAARYLDSRPWLVVSDTEFGINLHNVLSEDKGKGIKGVAPPEGKISVIAYKILSDSGDPTAGAGHKGPFYLDPSEPVAKELDRVLLKKAELTPPPATPLLVTQQTAVVESAIPPKK